MTDLLITGGSGFLGSTIQRVLISSNPVNLQEVSQNQDIDRIDLRVPFQIKQRGKIQVVIHAAGKAHSVPITESERQDFYQVNFEGTKNLCEALECLDELPRSFVFISTVAVYGVDEGQSIDERHPLDGATPYAESKKFAESWLENWAVDNNVTLGILRLPLIAGANPPGNLGALVNGIKSGKYLSIGKADKRKSMVWAEDIARIIPALVEKGGTYNLTDGHHPTFGELEEHISRALGKKKPIHIPYWAAKGLARMGDIVGSRFPINSDKLQKITSTLTFDDRKAREQLGWNPTPVLSKINEII